jgi:hypothetical protein
MTTEFETVDPASIPLDMLRRYLAATHWRPDQASRDSLPKLDNPAARALLTRRPRVKRNFDVYVSDFEAFHGVELIVPKTHTSIDYHTQISRIIFALATLEDRSEYLVYTSIREIGFDIVRSRIPDIYVKDGTIDLAVARNFVSGIRSVLAAAATTELNPSPFFLRLRKEAAEYADRCRFGHTFRGSFGFTIESPLEPNLQPPLPGLPTEPPFERRVIRRLARGLSAVSEAAASDSTAPIVSSLREGFSANVCEQFATLVEETSHSALMFEFSFSPEWRLEDDYQGDQTFLLGPAHVEAIRAAAKELRADVKASDETVFGRVIRLASEADPSDLTDIMGEREVAILWSSEALGDVAVRTSLSPADYLAALEAHATGKPVRVSGTLERRGRRWVLVNPTGFKA